MSPTWKRRAIMYAIFTVFLFLVYFANTAIQSHLGRKALQATGLPYHDLPNAMNLAREQSKLILVDLSAIWCSTCRKLDKEVFADQQVRQKILRDFIFVRIEYESEQGKQFKKTYAVQGFPRLLVLNSKGELVKHLPLTFDAGEFVQVLSQI